MKQMNTSLIIIALLGIFTMIVAGCSAVSKSHTLTPPDNGENTQIANPASVNCIDDGGRLDLVEDEQGGQIGMCTLRDGTVCEEWAYLRGECTKEYDAVYDMKTACAADNDCQTPGDYLIRSNCPYTSKCLSGNCMVVCPKFDGKEYPKVRECNICPQLSPPSPDFCKGGNIVGGGTDECGCNLPPRCEMVACTADAKLCPDGSAVGRSGPNCEFTPCPGEEDTGILKGKITIGPLCPVERVPPDPNCQPKQETFDAWPIAVYSEDTKMSDLMPKLDGTYSIELKPGEYTVKLGKESRIGGSNLPADITIEAGQPVVLDVDIDTGIR